MNGAVPPLPHYAFMAWCSVKAQGQLYLYVEFTFFYIIQVLWCRGLQHSTYQMSVYLVFEFRYPFSWLCLHL
jgi:hypothetical protein